MATKGREGELKLEHGWTLIDTDWARAATTVNSRERTEKTWRRKLRELRGQNDGVKIILRWEKGGQGRRGNGEMGTTEGRPQRDAKRQKPQWDVNHG